MKRNHIDVITMGCSKNLIDSQRLMKRLQAKGFSLAHDPERPSGEYVVVNTCGFIGDAKEESIDLLLELAELKKRRRIGKIVVMGCLSERYLDELKSEIPEVDTWYGKFNWNLFLETLPDKPADEIKDWERVLTGNPWSAFLKISEGCNRFCAFCAIPLITGRHKSRPEEEILEEVRTLVAEGVKEFNVIAQDLSSYGLDTAGEHRLPALIENMAKIPGVEWIRLHYAYPSDFPEDLLRVMRENDNVCKYIDIALQHISDNMLTRMRRHINREQTIALLDKMRREVPGIRIRTTLMVGFPGETEEDFRQLQQFVKDARFDRMGAFAYSEEDGTFAALNYEDDVPEDMKQQRLSSIMELQQDISAELNQELVGKTLKVLIDRQEGDVWFGRTQWDSPDVDQEVMVTSPEPLTPGEFVDVKITAASEFDLEGTAVL